MRKKFVQIVSLLAAVLAAVLCGAAPRSAAAAPDGASGLGARIMRVGIYYGSSGKSVIELKLTRGDGFQFGVYDDAGAFTPLEGVQPAQVSAVTVKTDPASNFGILVVDAAGGELCRYDDGGLGTGLAVRPYSQSGDKTVTKCGYAYYGGFRFERFLNDNELMTIVNYVPLDDYVEGVVPYESSASWPLEALKAQAVCARSYGMTRINASHQSNYHFDLCDSTHCQVYKGVYAGSYADKIAQAVSGTSGVTVRYNGEYCQTVYSASNGGASESNINVNGRDFPYLVGKVDPYEPLVADKISNYNWTKTFTGAQLRDILVADGYTNCGLITGVQTTLSPTGNVIALTFTDVNGKGNTIYRGRCRTLLALRSQRYSVTSSAGAALPNTGTGNSGLTDSSGAALDFSKGVPVIDGSGNITTVTGGYLITADGVREIGVPAVNPPVTGGENAVFTFTGTGWGHNVGLSQWGAYSMAQLGYTYQEILEFYYTGVTVS